MTKARIVLCYVAIAGVAPYLLLKLIWTAGGTLGAADPTFLSEPVVRVGNAFTAFLDLVAIAVVLAFTYNWGQRIPAWLVLFPIWVGTGLLAPIALSSPVIGFQLAVDPGDSTELESWVHPMVYASFAWQGVTLLAAFVLYARTRWPHVFTGVAARGPLGVLSGVGAVVAVVSGASRAWWVFDTDASVATRFLDGVEGVLILAGAAAVLTLAGRRLRARFVLAWTGSAVMFAAGFWTVFTAVAMEADPSALHLVLASVQALGGVLLALGLLATARDVAPERAFEPTREALARG
ncbi:hypothetical protein [Prauserella cavernicola]|uniref:Uncharacterized protein n=1 Tax=Prauserella cavernicola TaxID=2800127 RepID=A0A934V3K8_9PSEU|nr:hypothetical protein [Prauserella cavernicola]MBK1784467.1 hypothetical protein [Prauserella cavernicola]